jgi:hypothetical protein
MRYVKLIVIAIVSTSLIALVAASMNYLFLGSFSIPNPVWAGVVCGGLVVMRYLAPKLTQ